MGEAWSDLAAVEYLLGYGFSPVADENPFAVGPYATGNKVTGIRNFSMDASPLNFSNLGYDMTGPQVHADGEIWSAVNVDIRSALNARYDSVARSTDRALQARCADGLEGLDRCPGNRRWAQLMFDSYLLMPTEPSMLDARDALLAADLNRFGGANRDLMWQAFAQRGFGIDAVSLGSADTTPVPSFRDPVGGNGTVVFEPVDAAGAPVADAQLFVGRFQARSRPAADTAELTPLASRAALAAGSYELLVRAPGFGHLRTTVTVTAGQEVVVRPALSRNLAAASNGATATGDGVNLTALIDEDEATNWASLGSTVAGKQVTVRLAGTGPVQVTRAQLSAALRPRNATDPGGDTGGQNRFTALRAYELLACTATASTACTSDAEFSVVHRSAADAFPATRPRPTQPSLTLREATGLTPFTATHVRLRVVANQCTGNPEYAGQQDDDPRHNTDCTTGSAQALNVRAAELQLFGS